MFNIFYRKNNNKKIFKSLEKSDNMNLTNIQNYVPLYKNFFDINDKNYNFVNLDNKYSIQNLLEKKTDLVYSINVLNEKDESFKKDCFFKLSPLLDPIKYIMGKYKHIEYDNLMSLPNLTNESYKKVLDKNNNAYVDSFFSYLTSKLLHHHKFTNALDFYGSFLAIKNDFTINIIDELDCVYDCTYFHKNKSNLFEIIEMDGRSIDDLLDFIDTSNRKKRLKLNETVDIKCDSLDIKEYDDIFQLTEENLEKHNSKLGKVYESDASGNKSEENTVSTCSSRTSHTHSDSEELSVESDDEHSGDSSYSSLSDMVVNCKIPEFPIQIISLEKMTNTLDSLLGDDLTEEEEEDFEDLTDDEWRSCLFQIIMSLVTYQKCFDFTHNDLHSNNVMYIETDKKFLHYKYNDQYYKVPTFGKIYKIIDFGRSIYKFGENIYCSDSYHPKGDAATQYNCEPYFNPKKPRLEPNKSFDLCRLACALYDFFVEDIEDEKKIKNPVAKLIIEWCKDDKNRNILYKSNGDERYPEFKLYKMITRTVHKHTPEKYVEHPLFQKFSTSKKKIKKKPIMDIDSLPVYFK